MKPRLGLGALQKVRLKSRRAARVRAGRPQTARKEDCKNALSKFTGNTGI